MAINTELGRTELVGPNIHRLLAAHGLIKHLLGRALGSILDLPKWVAARAVTIQQQRLVRPFARLAQHIHFVVEGPLQVLLGLKPVFAQDAALRIALQGVPRHRLGESVDVSSKLGRVGRAAERNAVELVLHVHQRAFVVLLRLRAVLLGPRPLVPCPRAQRLGSVPHVRVLGQQVDRSAILASGKRLALPR